MTHAALDRYFAKVAKKSKNPSNFQLLVHSDKLDLHYTFATNSIHTPFHIASVGKTFTVVLLALLEERGQLSFGDPISRYLSPSVLSGLFLFEGVHYDKQVTIQHLVGHTSGVNDYFEGNVHDGPPFLDLLLNESNTFWTPASLLDFTRHQQRTVGAPGQRYLYSDTGYILLGLIIEAITGESFHDNLHRHLFIPIGMKDSYLMFYSKPYNKSELPIEEIWINGREISKFRSLSCDWSGGGIVSTVSDLHLFLRALKEGRLVKTDRLRELALPRHKFRAGMHYGLGLMEIRFEEFFFLLRGFPRLWGHSGVLSTHLYYDPENDAYIIMNMGSTRSMPKSFKAIIQIITALRAAAKKTLS
ncbi:serine hydrolase [Paenibacillus sp. PAMC21692]|uniref:serine hydrolase domain-containing protein n=1 Tax=Paenibacillus sp. PAMC21692 TaxID=2762320 RepID=UPI00164D39C1|nr:serine hydrolase domain-containing protein [Paenibacillus sp. PAMC21692]QNK57579.1 beta-lactamase family protein [Paenibacillus sp. PAMC21692]